jgi:aldose 1-epimerase
VNFASHAYWNLDGTPTLAGHALQVAADRYLPTDATALVTGETAPVAGTSFDFRIARPIGPGTEPRLDHNFCLAETRQPLTEALTLTGASGLALTVSTTEPGVQVFDAAPIDGGGAHDHAGRPIGAFAGLAIEPQGWPDAPNRPDFPPVVLRADHSYEQITRFRFHRG